jgi:hypothetical protein
MHWSDAWWPRSYINPQNRVPHVSILRHGFQQRHSLRPSPKNTFPDLLSKSACQAPNWLISMNRNEIDLAFQLPKVAILKVGGNLSQSAKSGQRSSHAASRSE